MPILEKFKSFIDGCLDFENPSAGCCKGISAIPGIQKEYKRSCEDDDIEKNKKHPK